MKYHVSKSGRPSPCTATVKDCPLGANNPHFNSMEETVKYIEETVKKDHKTFNTLEKSKTRTVPDDGVEFPKKLSETPEEFENNNKNNRQIVDGKYSGGRGMVDAIEKQILHAKVRGDNIEYTRNRRGLVHTIIVSGDYEPVKKLSDTVEYYNENYAPVHHIYNFNKSDYETIKKVMEEKSYGYDFPRKPIFGGKFEMPITLTRRDHKILQSELIKLDIRIQ